MMEDQLYLQHAGTPQNFDFDPHGSGRFRQGSGSNPYQHEDGLKGIVRKLRKDGLKDSEIAKMVLGEHSTASDLKAELTLERERDRWRDVKKARDLMDQYGSASKVAEIMFGDKKRESTVRSLTKEAIAEKHMRYQNTADYIRKMVDESSNGVVNVGGGNELYLGVTKDVKDAAIKILEHEGYVRSWVTYPQAGDKGEVVVKVLAKPGMTWKEIQSLKDHVDPLFPFTADNGATIIVPKPPVPIDSSRVFVRYGDKGGVAKDGTVEIKPGVDDVSLGGTLYSQVRIAVDGGKEGTGYMKGMAFYGDPNDFPPGCDIIYNTNKKEGTKLFTDDPKESSVFKPLKPSAENPFGATIKTGPMAQPNYIGKDGKEHQGVINKVNDEGDWGNWGKTVASQFVSKQKIDFIEQQISSSISAKEAELMSIRSLTNPVIKQKLLNDFAEQTESQTVKLPCKAPKSSVFQVLLPMPTLNNDEIYAPNFKDGTKVALIRYPHGGIFEIPILTVNNSNKEGQRILGTHSKDAVGINQHTAEVLSGADFDGDTAIVIPFTGRTQVSSREPLAGLKDWDHKAEYKLPHSAPTPSDKTKHIQIGMATNLITDMTVQGADWGEIERAVKYSMIAVDCAKHRLDYKRAIKELGIEELRQRYQGGGGASTMLSLASSPTYINKRKEVTDTKKMTPEQLKAFNAGKKVYVDSGKMTKGIKQITDPSKMTSEQLEKFNSGRKVYVEVGDPKLKQEKVPKIYTVDDARELVRDRDNPKEMAYANYANELKRLAAEARKEARFMDVGKADPSAKETYKDEVASLNAQLRQSLMNSPRETQAKIMARRMTNETLKNDYNFDIDYEHRKKIEAQNLTKARAIVGAKKQMIDISDREWEAIQAGAVAPTKLRQILNNTDQEKFKQRAMPKKERELSAADIAWIKRMKERENGPSNADIAAALNISVSTVNKY